MIGFEIKTSRGDWLRELKQPAKAEAFASGCHEWWLAAEKGVALRGEMPDGWGWMERSGTRLRVVVPATPKPRGFVPPWTLTVGVIRRAVESGEERRVEMAQQLLRKLRAEDRLNVDRRVRELSRDADRITRRAVEIKKRTGVDLLYGCDLDGDTEVLSALRDGLLETRIARRAMEQIVLAARRIEDVLALINVTGESPET